MTVELLRTVLLRCVLLNYAVLLLMFLAFVLKGDAIVRLHRRWFDLDRGTFHFTFSLFLGVYKLCILVFFLVPWLALTVGA